MLLGDRIKQLAEEKGVSLNEVARRTGIRRRYINKITANKVKEPGVFKVEAIADALGVTLDELLAPVTSDEESEVQATGTEGM